VLVRHGQSEGNVDESAYTRVPDPLIGLTPKGRRDAEDCGRRLHRLFSDGSDSDDWKVYFYVSPYRRTLETLRGIGLAFDARRIAGVREEPRLREQDFGTHDRAVDKKNGLVALSLLLRGTITDIS
jgi:broad specificity phosphatase PhoE